MSETKVEEEGNKDQVNVVAPTQSQDARTCVICNARPRIRKPRGGYLPYCSVCRDIQLENLKGEARLRGEQRTEEEIKLE